LLTALVQAFAEWTGERTLLVEQDTDGEDVFDSLSRTIGWLPPSSQWLLGKRLLIPSAKAVKDQLQ